MLDLFTTLALAGICIMMGFRLVDGSLTFWPALGALILAPEYFRPIREFASDFHASLDGKNALASMTELIARGTTDGAAAQDGDEGARPNRRGTHPQGDARVDARDGEEAAGIGTWGASSVLKLDDVGFSYPELTGPLEQATADTGDDEVEFVYDDDPDAAQVEAEAQQAWGRRDARGARETSKRAAVRRAQAVGSGPGVGMAGESRGTAGAIPTGISASEPQGVASGSPAANRNDSTPTAPRSALKGVSLRVEGFAKVGIVGMSGSGKSTLISVLGGFAAPTVGVITADGVRCASLHRGDWQRQVTYIPQSPYIFHATLRDNVAFYRPDATREQVKRALEVAGLDGLLAELPQGLDTLVGEGARTLSGGQAQRVALARAFLDDSRRILLFDEPTAHLDIETEMELKERMLPLMKGRLVFFATHRLHWMRDMDLIAVLEGGSLAQVGTPDELLSSTSGAFARLAAQLRGGDAR